MVPAYAVPADAVPVAHVRAPGRLATVVVTGARPGGDASGGRVAGLATTMGRPIAVTFHVAEGLPLEVVTGQVRLQAIPSGVGLLLGRA